MNIFENMLNKNRIDEFLLKKEKNLKYNSRDLDDFLKLKNYLTSDEYTNDIKKLINGDYHIAIPKKLLIKKINSSKRRVCYSYPKKDLYILQFLSFILMDFDNIYKDSVYSYRKNQSHRDFFSKLKKIDIKRKLYVLKLDIKNYGESVDQDILLCKLKQLFNKDEIFYNFLHWLIKRNQYYKDNKLYNENISIIPGTPIGAFFNNLYLMDIDNYIDKHSVLYMRYADDIAIFLNTYEETLAIKHYITKELAALNLQINPDKTKIYNPNEDFSILGIHISKNEFDISKESSKKIIFKIKHRLNKILILYRKKLIDDNLAKTLFLKYINRVFYSNNNTNNNHEINWTTWSFGIINTTKTLKYFDKLIQNCMRTIITKKYSKARYRATYEDIKKLGYKSLVHSYFNNHKK